jgi:hypothetical protein
LTRRLSDVRFKGELPLTQTPPVLEPMKVRIFIERFIGFFIGDDDGHESIRIFQGHDTGESGGR